MRPGRQGIALAATVFIVFAVLIFGMMLASLSAFQYQLTRDSANHASTVEAAQAGMAQAVYNLENDATFGTHKETVTTSISSDGSTYSISFDSASGLPLSTNNLTGGGLKSGYQGQLVPPYTALIVSEGKTSAGRDARVVEGLYKYAPYPYAIAATGTVNSSGALLVAGSTSLLTALANQHDGTGSVYGGSSSATAVTGGGGSLISGRVKTPGNAVFGPGSQVVGGIEADADADTVPDVNIGQYENNSFTGVTQVAAGATLVGPVTGVIHAQGDLTLLAATLVNAYIYVDNGGNLTSTGALLGTGSIFVTGKASLEGAVNSDASTGIAVFSQQDLDISNGQLFQGVLYTHGNLHVAGGVTVLGAVIAQSDGAGGNIALDSGAQVVFVPEYTQFGNAWTNQNMKGSVVNGTPCLMQQVFWRECTP